MLGSEISQRICAGGERGTERNGAEAHIVQIVDEPGQILALQTWNSILVFFPTEEVGELVVEIRRSSVELAELLEEIGQGHGDGVRGASRLSAERSSVHAWMPKAVVSG